jgi:hypothetical protein
MSLKRMSVLLVLGLALLPAVAGAGDRKTIDPVVLTGGFLEWHPDLRWRIEGMEAYRKGHYELALKYLLRAARYADKPSQGVIADMYWDGIGVPVDRAIAYAWMDLAAERMYPQFLQFRERYWNQLSEDERADAIERGQVVYAEYRDAVTKPRLETELRRGRSMAVGTRTGFPGTGASIRLRDGTILKASQYYASKYWEPERYWQLQDTIWRTQPLGKVNVGTPEDVTKRDAATSP